MFRQKQVTGRKTAGWMDACRGSIMLSEMVTTCNKLQSVINAEKGNCYEKIRKGYHDHRGSVSHYIFIKLLMTAHACIYHLDLLCLYLCRCLSKTTFAILVFDDRLE